MQKLIKRNAHLIKFDPDLAEFTLHGEVLERPLSDYDFGHVSWIDRAIDIGCTVPPNSRRGTAVRSFALGFAFGADYLSAKLGQWELGDPRDVALAAHLIARPDNPRERGRALRRHVAAYVATREPDNEMAPYLVRAAEGLLTDAETVHARDLCWSMERARTLGDAPFTGLFAMIAWNAMDDGREGDFGALKRLGPYYATWTRDQRVAYIRTMATALENV